MGFRAVIRQRFPSINIIDVVRWDSSRHGTYESAKSLLKDWPEIDGIYNTSGGNHGLAQALEESGRLGKTLFIAHEINPVTEPLVRADALDYLISGLSSRSSPSSRHRPGSARYKASGTKTSEAMLPQTTIAATSAGSWRYFSAST